MSTLVLPNEYGYVFAVLGGSFFMNGFLQVNVVMARKKYKIGYPNLYAPVGHKFQDEFNSVQRAHQNTLESLSYVMLSMAVVGLVHPISAAAFGGIWVVGRVIYGIGYAGSGPEGRYLGGVITHLGDIPLAIMSMRLAYTMIMKSRS